MKLDALISRKSRKDFYGLYLIAQQIPLPNLLALGEKISVCPRFEMTLVGSMLMFENADRGLQPNMLIELPWDKVRNFFIAEARKTGKRWLGEE